MNKYKILFLLVGIIFIWLLLGRRLYEYRNKIDTPPENITTNVDLIKWMGRPVWIIKHSSTNHIYYELGRSSSTILGILTAASGLPSYTVDNDGFFIGWNPDSGSLKRPPQLYTKFFTKERVDVDSYMSSLGTLAISQCNTL